MTENRQWESAVLVLLALCAIILSILMFVPGCATTNNGKAAPSQHWKIECWQTGERVHSNTTSLGVDVTDAQSSVVDGDYHVNESATGVNESESIKDATAVMPQIAAAMTKAAVSSALPAASVIDIARASIPLAEAAYSAIKAAFPKAGLP